MENHYEKKREYSPGQTSMNCSEDLTPRLPEWVKVIDFYLSQIKKYQEAEK